MKVKMGKDSVVISDFDEIVELDVNPFLTSAIAQNSKALDARIRLAMAPK